MLGARRSGARSRNSTADGPVSRMATLASSAARKRGERERRAHPARGARVEQHLQLGEQRERALRAGEQPAEVGLRGEQLAQVVAGGAAPRLREAGGDGLAVLLAHLRERRREPLPLRAAGAGRQLAAGAGAERRGLAAGEHGREAQDLVLALAVHDGAGAGRVVADHAGDRRLVDGGRVRTELEAVRRRGRVERRLHHAGLDASPAAVRVDLEDAVELEAVDGDAGPDRLPGDAGGGAARDDRQAGLRGDRRHGGEVVRATPPRRRPRARPGSRRRPWSRASAGAGSSRPRRPPRRGAPARRRGPPARARGYGDGRPCRLGYRPARRSRPRGAPDQSPPGLNTGIQRESCCSTPNIMSTPKTTSSTPAVTWMPR